MPDIIICANFGVKRLRDLGNTGGQILRFPIEMAGHPYNSATPVNHKIRGHRRANRPQRTGPIRAAHSGPA